MPTAKQRLLTLVDQLLAEGNEVGKIKNFRDHTNVTDWSRSFKKWHASCRNLVQLLGPQAAPWAREIHTAVANTEHTQYLLGILESIRAALEGDWLTTLQDLAFAEAFADLLEQAEYLLSEGYFVAAGVLGRAVLEEHLRKWCDHSGCSPTKQRPTLNDFKLELEKAALLNKIDSKHVDAMAAVGNEAAHNKPTLKIEDVERLVRDVGGFLAQHPLS